MAPIRRYLRPLTSGLAALAAALLAEWHVSTQVIPRTRHTRVGGHEAIESEVLVQYRTGHDAAALARAARFADLEYAERLNPQGILRLRSRRYGTAELLARLQADPDVEFAEPNYVRYVTVLPNDPSMSSLWGLLNTGVNPVGGGGLAGADIDADSAWNTTTGSRAYVVGVVDTGVDYNHPDLAANMWSAPSAFQVTIGGVTITCQAGTHGFNAIARTCTPMDDHRHGTHVAGTIGAVGNNGVGITGVNWIASMMALKFQGSGGTGYTSDAIAAIEFAIQAKAAFASTGGANVRVLSNSWGGGGYSQALANAVTAANDADILFVAAAGNSAMNNDASPVYPAALTQPNVLTVASSTSADTLSSFSNYGATTVHLAAPGSAILSTTPNNTYTTLQGTSMAAPHVSGAAVLTLARCSLTTAQLRTLLVSTVDLVPAFSGVTSSGGRLNAARAISNCGYPRVSSVELSADRTAPQPPGTTITWTASAAGGQAPYQYQWVVYDGSAWTAVTGWSTSNAFAWTPTTTFAGYQVAARVRSAWNSGTRELSAARPFAVMPRVTSLALTPSVAAPQAVGTSVRWTAAAAGGQAPILYQWAVYDGATWTTLQDWQTTATFTWTPSTANANYQVAVRAKGSWNPGSREMVTVQAYAITPKITSLSLTPNLSAPQAPNTTVTWTVLAGGGQPPYEYQWAVFDGVTWTTVTPWQSGTTYAWTPTQASTAYQVAVRARGTWNSGPREMAATAAYAVMPRVTSLVLTPAVASPQPAGATIRWTAAAAGGQAPYQYQWVVYDGVSWNTVTPWQAGSEFVWTPVIPNAAYQVAVRVRGSWNSGPREMATARPFTIQ